MVRDPLRDEARSLGPPTGVDPITGVTDLRGECVGKSSDHRFEEAAKPGACPVGSEILPIEQRERQRAAGGQTRLVQDCRRLLEAYVSCALESAA